MFGSRSTTDTLASRMMAPVVLCGLLVTLLGAVYLVLESRRSIESQAGQSARAIAHQVGQDRQKYIRRMTTEGADPTFLHEIGMSESGQGLYHVNLLGLWPINPQHAARDTFEARTLRGFLANTLADSSRVHAVNGEPTFTYMRPEIAVSSLCVDCHSGNLAGRSHQVAEQRPIGALVVEIPLGAALATARVNTIRAIALLVLIAAGMVVGILWMLRRLVERPVGTLLPAVEPLARGDFSRPVRVQAVAEIARIARAVEDTRSRVASVLGELARTVDTVQSASGDVSHRATLLSRGNHEQAAALVETASSLQAMTQTVRTNAEDAEKARDLAAHTRDQAQEGGQALREAVQAMGDIAAASRRIADISGTIDEIAFQTNLLALNAAVEAARAGEQGRSFAVVASEVRALAQRSAVASKEIRTVIGDAVARVDEGSVRVTRAGESLGGIVDEVKQVAELVAGIAGASADQARGIEQVHRAVEQMEGVTQSAAGQAGELDETARSLAAQAGELRRQVGQFTLGSDGATRPAARGDASEERRAA